MKMFKYTLMQAMNETLESRNIFSEVITKTENHARNKKDTWYFSTLMDSLMCNNLSKDSHPRTPITFAFDLVLMGSQKYIALIQEKRVHVPRKMKNDR